MDLLNYIQWDVEPALFTIFGREIRFYGILFAMAFLIGIKLTEKIFQHEKIDLKILDKLFVHILIGTVVGARLGHCFFYDPAYYLANPIDIIKIWEGGLASHGGAIGIFIGLWLFNKRVYNKGLFWVLDRATLAIAISCFFIRMGNLFNHEIVGHTTEVAWAFMFKYASEGPEPRHPVQLYEALSYLTIFTMVYAGYWKWGWQQFSGRMFGFLLTAIFSARFVLEYFKEKQTDLTSAMELNMGHFLSVPFIVIGLFLLFKSFQNADS